MNYKLFNNMFIVKYAIYFILLILFLNINLYVWGNNNIENNDIGECPIALMIGNSPAEQNVQRG